MRKRQIVAAMMLASMLLADRAVWAASMCPQPLDTAGRLIEHLGRRLRKTLPDQVATQIHSPSRLAARKALADSFVTASSRAPAHAPSLPFFFRLPPPSLAL